MNTPDAALRAARASAAIFPLAERALLEVRGGDRVRFLQGQLTNDVAGLDPAGSRSGCYALVLTAQGRIVADLHVLARPDAFWLETAASLAAAATARLEKYVIADDVRIAERGAGWRRFAIEGPRARALLAAAAPGAPLDLLPDAWAPLPIAGVDGAVAAFGWSGEDALQLFVPEEAGDAAARALGDAGARLEAVWGDATALEVLRIEAGVPRAGAELGEEVLPAEARLLERAVSFTKGCYTGQEVVARMHSRGRVGHLLVGVALAAGAALPAPGTPLLHAGAKVGELTSVALSPRVGPIGLGFVRAAQAEPGTELSCAGGPARVAALPFVAAGSGASAGAR
jgi:folate-binding protein YgfZ